MEDEELAKIGEGLELCVCHIQNDCPTHPKGDWKKPCPACEGDGYDKWATGAPCSACEGKGVKK